MVDDPEEIEVVARASQLRRQADFWNVEIPEDWNVTASDGAYFIGGLYHETLQKKIRQARWMLLFQCLGLTAAI